MSFLLFVVFVATVVGVIVLIFVDTLLGLWAFVTLFPFICLNPLFLFL